jgi:protein-S-isoprenylcysteine O-methyltransferase Ste14
MSREAAQAPPRGGLWLAVGAFAVLLAAMPFVPARPAPLMRALATTLLTLAMVFAGLPFLQLRRHGAAPAGQPFVRTTAVARRGLYAVVRHPQYLGYDFLVWGLAALTLYWGTILPAMAFTAGLAAQARAEEEQLLERFGDDYRAYRRMVPRFGLLTGFARYLRRRRSTART